MEVRTLSRTLNFRFDKLRKSLVFCILLYRLIENFPNLTLPKFRLKEILNFLFFLFPFVLLQICTEYLKSSKTKRRISQFILQYKSYLIDFKSIFPKKTISFFTVIFFQKNKKRLISLRNKPFSYKN